MLQLTDRMRSAAYLARSASQSTQREREMALLLTEAANVLSQPAGIDAATMSAIADVLQSQRAATMRGPGLSEFWTVDKTMHDRGIKALFAIFPIAPIELRSGPDQVDAPNDIL